MSFRHPGQRTALAPDPGRLALLVRTLALRLSSARKALRAGARHTVVAELAEVRRVAGLAHARALLEADAPADAHDEPGNALPPRPEPQADGAA